MQAELARGLRGRATSATLLNASSSRSHAGLTLHVTQRRPTASGAPDEVLEAKLHLVDLAGAPYCDFAFPCTMTLKPLALEARIAGHARAYIFHIVHPQIWDCICCTLITASGVVEAISVCHCACVYTWVFVRHRKHQQAQ